jgi:hypothetical protein
MDKIKIMESSVAKWDRIISGKGSDSGVLDCPPCRIFYVLVCTGCPIAAYTGKKFCKGSPYIEWYHHQMEAHGLMRRKIYCPECLVLAKAMRDFMQEVVDHMKEQEKNQK